MLVSMEPGIWIGAISTIAIWSFLVGDNPLWRVAESIFVALAAAWSAAYMWHNYIWPTFSTQIAVEGKYLLIIPVIIGLLIYTRYFPGVSWLARYPMSFWIGYSAGYILAFSPQPFVNQVTSSFIKFGGATTGETINNILLFIAIIGTLMYFFFTVKRDNPVMVIGSTFGRWTIMIALGAAFGSTALFRLSLLLGRIQYIFGDWLQIAGG